MITEKSQSADPSHADEDAPLPATMSFVLWLGGLILVGWFCMFALLAHRW
jgi:hypothetical protein